MTHTVDDWQMDCRPDLAEDSELWHHLLMAAKAIERGHPHSVYGALSGIRALGARLEMANGRLRIVRGEIDAAEYADIRERWLKPYREQIGRLLGIMDRWHDGQATKRSEAGDQIVA
jgi:hypothetical protein